MGWRGGNKSTDLCQNIVVVITAAAASGGIRAWEEEKIVASSDRFLPQVAVNSVSSTEKRNKKEAVIW